MAIQGKSGRSFHKGMRRVMTRKAECSVASIGPRNLFGPGTVHAARVSHEVTGTLYCKPSYAHAVHSTCQTGPKVWQDCHVALLYQVSSDIENGKRDLQVCSQESCPPQTALQTKSSEVTSWLHSTLTVCPQLSMRRSTFSLQDNDSNCRDSQQRGPSRICPRGRVTVLPALSTSHYVGQGSPHGRGQAWPVRLLAADLSMPTL